MAAVWRSDPDCPRPRLWTYQGEIKDHPRAEEDEEGWFVPGYIVCPRAPSDAEVIKTKYYHNPISDFAEAFDLIKIVYALEGSVLTLKDMYPEPSAVLIDAIQVLSSEINLLRRVVQ